MSDKITIDVRIFASLRAVLGVKSFPMQIKSGTNIRQFLSIIEEEFETGKDFVKEIMDPDPPDRVKDYVKFVINGKILFSDDILDTKIDSEGAVIAIFPPIGGG